MKFKLEKYQLKFRTNEIFNKKFKSISTINDMLTCSITDHNALDRANQLLTDINNVLNGDYSLGGGETQSLYYATITISETKIYSDLELWEDNNISPDYILRTPDFKVIVEAWRDYLMS